jgi:hypothetical protein
VFFFSFLNSDGLIYKQIHFIATTVNSSYNLLPKIDLMENEIYICFKSKINSNLISHFFGCLWWLISAISCLCPSKSKGKTLLNAHELDFWGSEKRTDKMAEISLLSYNLSLDQIVPINHRNAIASGYNCLLKLPVTKNT